MSAVLELLDIAFRWLHVIAGIMWVGNSLLFNWLDRNLRPAADPVARSMGEIWLLHSGGFYQVEKTLALGDVPPRSVHWFKWQAYTTWLSGAALLIAIYYLTGGALLSAPDSGLSVGESIAVGAATIVGGWVLYEAIWRSPLARTPRLTGAMCVLLLIALGYALPQIFTGRAAFLHIGALMGTLMAGNVKFHIIPSQRAFVAELERGIPGDERLSIRAKTRSIHNNYLTFPVIVLMLSSHFPALYSRPSSWAVIALLILGGAAIRHILNIRFAFDAWIPSLAVTMAALLAGLYLLGVRAPSPASGDNAVAGEVVTFDDAVAIVHKRCTVCHSVSPADRTLGAPPAGVAFDTPEQIRAMAPRILERAVVQRTMPPANKTWITDEERAALGRWAQDGGR